VLRFVLSVCSGICVLSVLAACSAQTVPIATPPPTVDTGSAGIEGGRLYFESAGKGTPVILIHAGNVDRRMWDDQFQAFAREHRVVRYDLRGYGRSSAASVPFEAHRDLEGLMAALGIPRASLVGLSGGGRIAIDFALSFPAMVDQLVLAAPGISGWPFAADDTSWFAKGRALRDRGDTVGVVVTWANHSLYMRSAMRIPTVAGRLRQMAGDNAGQFMARVRRRGEIEREVQPPALGRTAGIRIPTLLLIGDQDVSDIRRIADTLMASIPGIRRETLSGVGHFINMERPAEFNRVVLAFLRR
jgi:3-oxoadipate enol-lactonase